MWNEIIAHAKYVRLCCNLVSDLCTKKQSLLLQNLSFPSDHSTDITDSPDYIRLSR
jgi:hypothetical protein